MPSPAHQIINQQRHLVAELRGELAEAETQSRDGMLAELRAKLVEAETQLKGMERIFEAVFGSGSKDR